MDSKAYKSTEPETLEQHIMDSTIAKSEVEWWANREIARLRAELEQVTKERDALLNQLSDIRIAVAKLEGFFAAHGLKLE